MHVGDVAKNGPGRYCSPRHRIARRVIYSTHKVFECVSMTRRAISARPYSRAQAASAAANAAAGDNPGNRTSLTGRTSQTRETKAQRKVKKDAQVAARVAAVVALGGDADARTVGGDGTFLWNCLKFLCHIPDFLLPGNIPKNAENSAQTAQAQTAETAHNFPESPKMPKIPEKVPKIPGTFRRSGIAYNAEKTCRHFPSPPSGRGGKNDATTRRENVGRRSTRPRWSW